MPNHIKNKLEIIGSIEQIDAITKLYGTKVPASLNRTHDGESVICNSKKDSGFCWLDLSTGKVSNRNGLNQIGLPNDYEPEINQGFFCFPDFEKVIPPPSGDPAYKDLPSQDVAKNSPNWWYNWNTENWGTKWSAYSCEQLSINIFKFETAWSSVSKIVTAMSQKFPDLTIKYTWADEDSGYNCGTAIYKNGLVEQNIPEGGSKEAYEIYFELNPDSRADYQFVNGKYEYVEQD